MRDHRKEEHVYGSSSVVEDRSRQNTWRNRGWNGIQRRESHYIRGENTPNTKIYRTFARTEFSFRNWKQLRGDREYNTPNEFYPVLNFITIVAYRRILTA